MNDPLNKSAAPESVAPAAETTTPQPAAVNEAKLQQVMDELKAHQNLLLGAAAGTLAALVGAAVWAGITIATNYKIGWIAMGIGLLVGWAVRFAGKGINPTFGFVGASLAFLGCALGDVLICYILLNDAIKAGELEGPITSQMIIEVFKFGFSPIDLLFYGIAIYEGYKFSFRQITQDEIMAMYNR